MSEEIPRAFWPRRGPIASLMCGLLSLAVIPVVISKQQQSWTSLQRFYLSSYIRSAILPGCQNFEVLYIRGRGAPQFALDPWVTAIPRGVKLPAGLPPFLLTVDGRRHGGQWLQIVKLKQIDSATFHRGLRQWIYEGRFVGSLFRLSIELAVLALLVLLPFGIRVDRRRYRELRLGKKIRGPELLTPHQFNQRVRGDGLAFLYRRKRVS